MAIPVSNWWGQWHDFESLEQHVDFFNYMVLMEIGQVMWAT